MMSYRDPNRYLLTLALSAMGLATAGAAGCGGNVIVEESKSAGGQGGQGGQGQGGAVSSSSFAATSSVTASSSGTGTASCPPQAGGVAVDVCLPMTGDYCPPGNSDDVLMATAAALGICAEVTSGACCNEPYVADVICDLIPGTDTCCYVVETFDSGLCIGRPFIVAGVARKAPLTRHSGWATQAAFDLDPAVCQLGAPERVALAAAWAEDAALEHASVASFARLALELLGLGAPRELLALVQQAMGDEIRHAELCYSLASRYAGAALGPSPLAVDGALSELSLAKVAEAAAREGCIGETIAALVARAAAEQTTDPVARHALEVIADDEASHAALSFRIVAWAYRSGDPAVREAIARALSEASPPQVTAFPEGVDPTALRTHGRLESVCIQSIAREALAGVIRPAFAALVRETQTTC